MYELSHYFSLKQPFMILGVSDITETFIIQLQLKIVYISGSNTDVYEIYRY